MNIQPIIILLLAVYAGINFFSFFLMLDDKKRARQEDMRISEGKLLFAAICFGALGIWLGMFVAHHKTQKMIFFIGVPLALLQNLSVVYLVYMNIVVRL
jgi:uncharacterized membrane protein YsdA (DUF1294 family)